MLIKIKTAYFETADVIRVHADATSHTGAPVSMVIEMSFESESDAKILSFDKGLAYEMQVCSTPVAVARIIAELESRTTEDTTIPLNVGEFSFEV